VSAADLDVVYIATTHPAHLPMALLSLEAGKPTVVEKPLGLNALEARRIADAARQGRVLCMEALWTLFLPKFDVIRQILDSGLLGDVRSVLADDGEWFSADHRIMDPAQAGGPMLDLGTYPARPNAPFTNRSTHRVSQLPTGRGTISVPITLPHTVRTSRPPTTAASQRPISGTAMSPPR
jgi:predicted dehydrogenase